MPKRAIYKDRYERAINHIKYDTEIEELYFKEMEDCMRNIKKIKGAKGTETYFNHIDFILESIFGVKVYLGN